LRFIGYSFPSGTTEQRLCPTARYSASRLISFLKRGWRRIPANRRIHVDEWKRTRPFLERFLDFNTAFANRARPHGLAFK
jgi:hypothetical protein